MPFVTSVTPLSAARPGPGLVVGNLADVPVGSLKLVKVDGRRLCLVHTSSGVHALDNACPHEGYGLTTGDARRRTAHVRVAQLEVPRRATARACSARRTCAPTPSTSPTTARSASRSSSPTRPSCDPQLLASLRRGIEQGLRRPGLARCRAAAARRRQPGRADLGGGRLRRAARRVRVGALDRVAHRLPGDDRPLRRRPAGAADRAGDRRHRRGGARPSGQPAARPERGDCRTTRAPSSAGSSRPSSSSRRRRCCAARSTPATTPTRSGRGSPTSSAITCSRTGTARSTPRRRSSCSTGSAGSGPTRCCRTSCRRSCTAPARTSCRTCGRSTAALAQLDLDELAEARRRPTRTGRTTAGCSAALLGPDRTEAALRGRRRAARRGRGRRRARRRVDARSASGCCATTRPASSTSTTTSAGSTSPTASPTPTPPAGTPSHAPVDRRHRAARAVDACSSPTGPAATSGTRRSAWRARDRAALRRPASPTARRCSDEALLDGTTAFIVHAHAVKTSVAATDEAVRLRLVAAARCRRPGSWRRRSWSASSPPP